MLSYRHAFHAGNFADVLKHLIQVEILNYLHQKDKPFVYIDTHSGAGLYSLHSAEAEKNAEYMNGIGTLRKTPLAGTEDYLAVVDQVKPAFDRSNVKAETLYPGSPRIAQILLREQDRAQLYELHPTDFVQLQELMRGDRRIRVDKSDGYAGLISSMPPKERRALVLMDPPYEVKTDYDVVVSTLIKAHKRFPTGIYALWYPVVDRTRIDRLVQQLKDSGIPKIQMFELGLSADTDGRGMTSSGMIVINPPWTLMANMQKLLPTLAQTLAGAGGVWRCDEISGE
ncbi:23S rRNA (adenine(2030)-N(6))-methyltransferase RlmJ [Thalassolituus sp. LLYu03]|uniref:23S rRNA (adenine(2030)-N(6))-methyltransferase RlmJ n=1 Tax=Thalassolituus sp. LLYu03 TaxID=3421656 RepID=UPI003D28C313